MQQKICIIGATSAIASAVAKHYAKEGAELFLVGRSQEKLNALVEALPQTTKSYTTIFEALSVDDHASIVIQAKTVLKSIDMVLIAHGVLPDQALCQENPNLALSSFSVNATSVIGFMERFASVLEAQGSGHLVVIGSVAGDRGRASNYVYGAAKAAVDVYAEGLEQRLFKKGVHVLNVKPGFVDTPMTATFKKSFMWSTPEKVAKDIARAVRAKKSVLYTPRRWALIMGVIRSIPRIVFKRLSL